jgi:hypothetical protein
MNKEEIQHWINLWSKLKGPKSRSGSKHLEKTFKTIESYE